MGSYTFHHKSHYIPTPKSHPSTALRRRARSPRRRASCAALGQLQLALKGGAVHTHHIIRVFVCMRMCNLLPMLATTWNLTMHVCQSVDRKCVHPCVCACHSAHSPSAPYGKAQCVRQPWVGFGYGNNIFYGMCMFLLWNLRILYEILSVFCCQITWIE